VVLRGCGVVVVVQVGEVVADLVGLGDAEGGVEGEGALPVVAGVVWVSVGVVGVGEAVVCAGLFIWVAGLSGQGQGGAVVSASLVVVAGGVPMPLS
jgi:hypothetical protein